MTKTVVINVSNEAQTNGLVIRITKANKGDI